MAATSKKPFFSVSGIDISSDRGNSASDFITNVAVQTITGRLSKKLAASDVLYGSVDNGVTWVNITSKVSGTAISWNDTSLLPGSNTIVFKLADANGNFSAPAGNRGYTLDTAAPELTVSSLRLSADSGASASDFITKTRTQTISGTLSAKLAVGEALYGSVDNGATWTNITSKVSDTTITWKGAALKSGDNVILFKVVDVAGNTSTFTGNQAYTLDTAAPVKPTLALAVDSGSSGSDKLTSNGTVVVGGLEAGARWQYTTDNGKSWTDGSGNSLTLAGGGRKTVQVRQTDLAGNTATSAQFTFTLDATGPTQTINNVDIGTDSGYSASDFITNAATQTITGTLSKRLAAGDVLYGSVDNGVTWSNITSKVNGTAIAWNAATLQEGNGTILLKVADAAGNDGIVTRQAYTLDTAATAPTLALAADTGASAADGITNNGTINVGGLETGATWQYSLDHGATWTTGSGTSFTVTSDGAKSVIVRQTDAAGNVSANSTALGFTLDTAAPAALLSPPVRLEPNGVTNGDDDSHKIAAVGTNGEFVVTWQGKDLDGDRSIFVQKFNAEGITQGGQVMLAPSGVTNDYGFDPQIAAVGTDGEFVVTWQGKDTDGDLSIFVQKFNVDGTAQGGQVILEANGVTSKWTDGKPQVAAVGTNGEFVISWCGYDGSDFSIFVQKFNANGSTAGNQVMLESDRVINNADYNPKATAIGSVGEYVITWEGYDGGSDARVYGQRFNANGTTAGSKVILQGGLESGLSPGGHQTTAIGTSGEYVVTSQANDADGDWSIFVQKFNADGTTAGSQVMLEASGRTNGQDGSQQIAAVGVNGEYVVTWTGHDIGLYTSIFVQKFNADGTTQGDQVKLAAEGRGNGWDGSSQIAEVGTNGEYVVTWQGVGAAGGYNIFVQKFNADGTTMESQAKLDTHGGDYSPQITALDTSGAFAVSWKGQDSEGDSSIFVQKFNADGTKTVSDTMQSSETGMAYLVKTTVSISDVLSITQAADNLWNSTSVAAANTNTTLQLTGLDAGAYALYMADAAGNLSAAASQTYQVL